MKKTSKNILLIFGVIINLIIDLLLGLTILIFISVIGFFFTFLYQKLLASYYNILTIFEE
tara:strand:+ start:1180 stop:1359 length:180 start_codon:yes stop_codon:yes gene_type:complete